MFFITIFRAFKCSHAYHPINTWFFWSFVWGFVLAVITIFINLHVTKACIPNTKPRSQNQISYGS